MDDESLDALRDAYIEATDRWVEAIRAQQTQATLGYSEVQMERWDAAGFALSDRAAEAQQAHDAFKDALRKKNYGF